MANFPALKMTAAGKVLQAKAQTGQELKFSRVGLGDGTLSGSLDTLLALVAERKSLSIRDHQAHGDGTAVLQVIATNEGLATGFYIREVGLFALDPDTGEEVLYSYTNAGDESDFLPAAGGPITYEGLFDLITVVGNAENVTAVIDDYITIALKTEVEALRPYILPTGGTVGQMPRKRSNADGDTEWFTPELEGLDIRLRSVEEPRTAVANQRTFTLQKTVTNGLAVYVEGKRLPRDAWTPLSSAQLQLADPLQVGAQVLFVNNEEAGPAESLSVSLEGPTLVYPGSSNTFTIGPYDSFSDYSQTTTLGTLTRTGKTLTLVVPAGVEPGTLDLEVIRDNVKVTRRVALGAAAIARPEMLTPAPNASGVGFEPDLTTSPFTVYPAGFDRHVKTRWQVAFDAAFTQMIYDQESTVNLTALNLGAVGVRLPPSRQIFWRAKAIGETLASEFGVAASFNTAAVYIRTPTITSPVDGQLDVSLSATLTGDDFSVYGGNDEHVASRWQYSTVPDFSTVLIDSGWVASPLKSYSPSVTIPRKTRLYGRLKYKGKLLGESEWSQVVSFVTADQLKGIYTQKASGPTIVSFGLMVEIGGDIYLTGGSSKLETWKYSPAQNSWTQLANALAYIYETESAAVIDGKLYVCGATGPSRSKRLYRYNPQNNTWADLGAAPGESAGCYMGAIGGKLYLFGGRGYSNIGSTSMHEYDPGTGLWTQKTALPSTGRYDVAGGVIGGKLYIAGGIRDGSMGGTSRADTWSYEPSLDKWTQLASMPWAKYLAAGAVVDGRLYVDGGNNSDGSYGGSLLMYDPVANGWAEIQNNLRTQNRRDHAAVGVGSKMYIYCAVGTAGTLYQVE